VTPSQISCTCRRHYPGAASERNLRSFHPDVSVFPDRVVGSLVLFEMLWGGGEEIASIALMRADGSPQCKR